MRNVVEDSYDVPALRRTHDVLEILAHRRAPVRAAALAEAAGLSRSTLYLLLDSLERRKWVEKHHDGYTIGVKLFELGSTYVRHDGLQAAFRAYAAAFVAMHNEVVQLAVLDGAEVVYIAREDARRGVRLVSDLGSRLPAHCCALGKALLASLTDEEVAALLPERLEALTVRTITHRALLIREFAGIRKSGLASDHEEVTAGLICMAAYVGETALGRRVAISTSVPRERIDARREKQIATGIAQLAAQIGQAIR